MTATGTDATNRLEEALGRVPRSVEPARDLWPAIEARIDARVASRPNGPRRYAWQAAAAVLLVVASSILTASLVRRDLSRVALVEDHATHGLVAPVPSRPAAFRPGYALDPGYMAAREQLSDLLASRLGALPASARQKLEANLAEIRRASAEINAALALQPGDPLLEELLLNTYQDELAVLASASQLTAMNGAQVPPDEKGMQL